MSNRKSYELALQIGGKIKSSLKGAFNAANKQLNRTERNAKRASTAIGSCMRNYVLGGIGAAAGYRAARAIKDFATESIEAARAQNLVDTKLEAVLKNVKTLQKAGPNAYKAATKELIAVAGQMQKVGVIGDEVTIAGQQQLATFQLSHKEIGILTEGMGDLLAQQKGLNATQQDAVNAANLMGKAMSGQVGALGRVGITFTKNQAKILKTGDSIQRAATLAEVLKENFGGVNKALAKTDDGKIQQTNNNLGDMQEVIGRKLIPKLAKIYSWVNKNIPAIQSGILKTIDIIEKVYNSTGKLYNALKPWTPLLAGITAGFVAYKAVLLATITAQKAGLVVAALCNAYTTLSAAVALLSEGYGVLAVAQVALNGTMLACPAVWIALAIGGVVAAGVLLYQHWDKIGPLLTKHWNALKEVACIVFGGIWEFIVNVVKSIAGFYMAYWGMLFNFAKSGFDAMWKVAQIAFKGIQTAIKIAMSIAAKVIQVYIGYWINNFNMVKTAAMFLWNGIQTVFGLIASYIKDRISKTIQNAVTAGQFLLNNWNNLKTSALSLWATIQGSLGQMGTFLKGVFQVAWAGIKVYINNIIGGLNQVIKGANSVGKITNVQIPVIPMLAKGTNNFAGGLAIVGERGPELVDLPGGSKVIPNNRTERLVNSLNSTSVSSGITVNYSPNITINGNADPGTIQEATDRAFADFERKFKDLVSRQKRLGYSY